MENLSGRCMCGAVTWDYKCRTTRNLICYCADCQRATSSPMTAFVGLLSEHLTWSGKIEHYSSSAGVYRGFCPACGTRLYFKSVNWPTETHVHAATLANPADYRPDAQVLIRGKAEWLNHLDQIPGHDGFQRPPAVKSKV